MQAIVDCCCGLDVHKERIFACVLRGAADQEPEVFMAEFGTTATELQELCSFLSALDCGYVAMESTGVYWRPVYEACEAFLKNRSCLMVVNAHHMRNLPGRKSDVSDAQWIATLFRHGLLEPSFVPERAIRNIRELVRLYRTFVRERVDYVNRLEKFLQAHGFKLSSVLSDIFSLSGRRLLGLLSEHGSLSVETVANAVHTSVRKTPQQILAAMQGNLEFEERMLLKVLLSKIDDCSSGIADLNKNIVGLLESYKPQLDQLDSIPGIDTVAAFSILAEISPKPQEHFENSKRIASWAGLSPRNDESAGKVKSRKITKGNPYIKSILCQAAWAAVRVRKSPFAIWFWSHQGKLGKKKAIIAVARKILELSFKLLKSGEFYDPLLAFKPIQSQLQ